MEVLINLEPEPQRIILCTPRDVHTTLKTVVLIIVTERRIVSFTGLVTDYNIFMPFIN